jgi:RNA polymerase sigma-70 factor (ECF subfamily)
MDNNKDYVELVEQARLGNKENLDILAQRVRGRLYAYVYRIILREDISQDIVQESLLEMFNSLDKLEQADHFWPWLCRIAFYKTRRYYTKERRHRTVSTSDVGDWVQDKLKDERTGLTALVGEELKQLVFDAMRQLKPQHRAVLAMRCYEEMQYSQIAQLMGSSELRTRVLFYRAKEALRKHFSRKGFGKGFLLSALALFGRMTAPADAAASSVTVTSAATKVGATAAVVGAATSKTTVVTLATAAALAAGTILTPLPLDKAVTWTNKTADTIRQKVKSLNAAASTSSFSNECWYYYPDKAGGAVMTAMFRKDPQTKYSYCQWLEDDHANYYFDKPSNTVYIRNHRMWRDNLTAARLPTDKPELTGFLAAVDGQSRLDNVKPVSSNSDGLLVIVDDSASGVRASTSRHHNVTDEEYFRYNWPAGIKIIDSRDAMHKRGWTYFSITGHINGEKISGAGRIPFVYAASKQYYPWLKLNVDDRLEIVSTAAGAGVYNAEERTFTTYRPDTFLKGLARPWMGLPTIDTIRRDAAEKQLPFETKYAPNSPQAEVILLHKRNKIVYTIDMEKDVIDKITLLTNKGETKAELNFSYLDDVSQPGPEYAEPKEKNYGVPLQDDSGLLWIVRLMEGSLPSTPPRGEN